MTTYRKIGLFVVGAMLLAMAFTSCHSVTPIPSAPHREPVRGESRWN